MIIHKRKKVMMQAVKYVLLTFSLILIAINTFGQITVQGKYTERSGSKELLLLEDKSFILKEFGKVSRIFKGKYSVSRSIITLNYLKFKELDSAKYQLKIKNQNSPLTSISVKVRDSLCVQELGYAFLKLSKNDQEWLSFVADKNGSENIRISNQNYTKISVLLMGAEPFALNIEPYHNKDIFLLVCMQKERPFLKLKKEEVFEISKRDEQVIELKPRGEGVGSYKKTDHRLN